MLDKFDSSDGFLLSELKNGNRSVFSKIYEQYWEKLYYTALKILKDGVASQDLVQDVFIDLWQSKHKKDIYNLDSYLSKAIKYRVFRYIRNQKDAEAFLERINRIESVNQTEQNIQLKELELILNDNISTLPIRCKEVFLLSRYNQLSHKEISNRLGISVKTVENQITKALKHLKQAISVLIMYCLF